MPATSKNVPVVSDDLGRAVEAEAGWIEDLTCRLVEIPSLLGGEEPARVVVERETLMRDWCGVTA